MKRVNVVIKHHLPQIGLRPQTLATARQNVIIVAQRPSRPSLPQRTTPPPSLVIKQPPPAVNQKRERVLRTKPAGLVAAGRVPAVVQRPSLQMRRTAAAAPSRTLISSLDANIQRLKGVGKGRILIIVGNGPSINEAPLERLKNVEPIDIMSINKPDKRLWPTKWWAFCDQSQYLRHPDQWQNTGVYVITATAVRASDRKENRTIVKAKSGKGFSKDLTQGYHIARSSCYANMQTAYYMDYDKVFLFGVDMNPNVKVTQFYGNNPDVAPEIRKDRFKHEAESYQWAAENLSADERKRFIFCSSVNPWAFVNAFGDGKLDHKTAVDVILTLAEEMRKKTP